MAIKTNYEQASISGLSNLQQTSETKNSGLLGILKKNLQKDNTETLGTKSNIKRSVHFPEKSEDLNLIRTFEKIPENPLAKMKELMHELDNQIAFLNGTLSSNNNTDLYEYLKSFYAGIKKSDLDYKSKGDLIQICTELGRCGSLTKVKEQIKLTIINLEQNLIQIQIKIQKESISANESEEESIYSEEEGIDDLMKALDVEESPSSSESDEEENEIAFTEQKIRIINEFLNSMNKLDKSGDINTFCAQQILEFGELESDDEDYEVKNQFISNFDKYETIDALKEALQEALEEAEAQIEELN